MRLFCSIFAPCSACHHFFWRWQHSVTCVQGPFLPVSCARGSKQCACLTAMVLSGTKASWPESDHSRWHDEGSLALLTEGGLMFCRRLVRPRALRKTKKLC
ncbi:unnamed protein product, partial [Hapterophycus canaliculatus]